MTVEFEIRRNARDQAVKALVRSYDGQARCHELLEQLRAKDRLSEADAALAAQLVVGVSRHRITCEHIASRFYRGRWQGVRVPIRVILSLGVYQLCWMDRIPDHAAVDQSVRQARRHGQGTGSVVNAVLRKVAACRGDVVTAPENPDLRRFLPLDEGRGRLFTENVFPDPARRPLDYLIAIASHPSWLVERWHRRFKPQLCREILEAGRRRPPLVLRPNTTRIDASTLRERIAESGHEARLNEDETAVILDDGTSASQVVQIDEGLCQPQDTTAQKTLRLNPPKPGQFVLDLCAGVGTKSTQAAELMNDEGLVIATDINAEKLASVRTASERLGLKCIRTVSIDELPGAMAEAAGPPDIILVDAPCTNSGVLARRPEARYRAGATTLNTCVEIQKSILQHADALSGPATRIIYATCSLEAEENESQAEAFCQAHADWRVLQQELTLPGKDRDGGFTAVLARAESARGS